MYNYFIWPEIRRFTNFFYVAYYLLLIAAELEWFPFQEELSSPGNDFRFLKAAPGTQAVRVAYQRLCLIGQSQIFVPTRSGLCGRSGCLYLG